MPTEVYVTMAYISSTTSWWDVDFYVSPRFSSQQLQQYIISIFQQANADHVKLLEVTVIGDDREVWRWTR